MMMWCIHQIFIDEWFSQDFLECKHNTVRRVKTSLVVW